MDLYLTEAVEASIRKEYHYVFDGGWYPGLPELRFFNITNRPFYIGETKFQPVEVMHHKMAVFGYRIQNFCYITDANYISDIEKEKLKNVKVLIINALRKETHYSHFNLQQALEIVAKIKPERAYFTHISHHLGLHDEVEKELPNNVFLAFDGLQINM